MKLTNKQIVDSYNTINSLCNKEMPVSLSFKLAKAVMDLQHYYDAYGIAVKKLGNNEEKLQELLEIKNDVPVTPFLIEEFERAEITLTPAQAYGLGGLING